MDNRDGQQGWRTGVEYEGGVQGGVRDLVWCGVRIRLRGRVQGRVQGGVRGGVRGVIRGDKPNGWTCGTYIEAAMTRGCNTFMTS